MSSPRSRLSLALSKHRVRALVSCFNSFNPKRGPSSNELSPRKRNDVRLRGEEGGDHINVKQNLGRSESVSACSNATPAGPNHAFPALAHIAQQFHTHHDPSHNPSHHAPPVTSHHGHPWTLPQWLMFPFSSSLMFPSEVVSLRRRCPFPGDPVGRIVGSRVCPPREVNSTKASPLVDRLGDFEPQSVV